MTSKTMVCDLAVLSASSLGTCRCILSGPTDLKLSVSLIGLKPDLFLELVIPPSPIPSLPLLSLVWVSHLPSEDWGKAVVYLSLVLVPSNQFSYTTLKYLNKHMEKKPPKCWAPCTAGLPFSISYTYCLKWLTLVRTSTLLSNSLSHAIPYPASVYGVTAVVKALGMKLLSFFLHRWCCCFFGIASLGRVYLPQQLAHLISLSTPLRLAHLIRTGW